MADFDIHVDELCMLYEYQQGTLFNGLEYFDTVEEGLDISCPTYIVFVDELSETMGFSESYAPVHMLVVLEGLGLEEQFGFPSQVSATSLEVIHGQVVRPVDICYFGLEVLHGVDIFWEEVSSEIHSTSFAKGVPYHWLMLYEYFEVLDDGTIVKVTFSEVPDRINMRHTVTQLYNFNNFVNEQLFTYGWPGIAWGKAVDENLSSLDALSEIIGLSAIDYLWNQDKTDSKWIGEHLLKSGMFSWDKNDAARGYECNADDALAINDCIVSRFLELIMEAFATAGDISSTNEKKKSYSISSVAFKEYAGVSRRMTAQVNESMSLAPSTPCRVDFKGGRT